MTSGRSRRRGGRRVVAAGVFDGLHAGHHWYLRKARAHGTYLTVVVARDTTVPLLKGKTARRSERARLAAVARLPYVDRAVLGNRLTSANPAERFRILRTLRADLICLGYDQPVRVKDLRAFLRAHGLPDTRVLRLPSAPTALKLRQNVRSSAGANGRRRARARYASNQGAPSSRHTRHCLKN